MPITPIEIATMAPKSQETVLARHAEVQKPVTDQQNALTQVETKVVRDTSITIRSKQSDTPEFRYDAKNKGGTSYDSRNADQRKRKKQGNEKETEEEKKIGHGIDIRI